MCAEATGRRRECTLGEPPEAQVCTQDNVSTHHGSRGKQGEGWWPRLVFPKQPWVTLLVFSSLTTENVLGRYSLMICGNKDTITNNKASLRIRERTEKQIGHISERSESGAMRFLLQLQPITTNLVV